MSRSLPLNHNNNNNNNHNSPSTAASTTQHYHHRKTHSATTIVSANTATTTTTPTTTTTTPTTVVGHTIRRLSDDDVRTIFECLHHGAPLPDRLKFTIVPVGANGLKLSPPSYEFQGMFCLYKEI